MALSAVIFDMDGLLINSEPFWQTAEIEVLGALGIHLTPAESSQTIGMRIDQVVNYYYGKYPWQGPTVEAVTQALLDKVIHLVQTEGEPQPGVYDVLEFCASTDVYIGLATSSYTSLMDAVLDRLGIRQYFETLCSAEHEVYGKPHPAVFLTAAANLGVAPEKCLVFEDSLRGVIAAKAAQMRCVCVPDHSLVGDPRLSLADIILPTLEEFNDTHWHSLNQ